MGVSVSHRQKQQQQQQHYKKKKKLFSTKPATRVHHEKLTLTNDGGWVVHSVHRGELESCHMRHLAGK